MIGVDTHVLIWGIKRASTPNRADMIPRASQLLESLSRMATQIMVPSLVLSEFLVKYSVDERIEVLTEMQRRFFIAPFDGRAAAIAARLYAESDMWKQARDESGTSKQFIKVDISILATIEAHRPDVFYVEDEPLQNLAGKMQHFLTVPVLPLPALKPRQRSVFDLPANPGPDPGENAP